MHLLYYQLILFYKEKVSAILDAYIYLKACCYQICTLYMPLEYAEAFRYITTLIDPYILHLNKGSIYT